MLIQTDSQGLRVHRAANLFSSGWLVSRLGRRVLGLIVALEGGGMTSSTLRRVLSDRFQVQAGPHSYGSLLDLGMCDPYADIGAYCSIGKNVRRYGAAHPIDGPSMHPYFYNPSLGLAPQSADVERKQISIGPDAWIGSNVTILPGCSRIGFGAVVGAGSVVTKDIPDFAIAVGNPARVVKYRHTPEMQNRILQSRYWELKPAAARDLIESLGADLSRGLSRAVGGNNDK